MLLNNWISMGKHNRQKYATFQQANYSCSHNNLMSELMKFMIHLFLLPDRTTLSWESFNYTKKRQKNILFILVLYDTIFKIRDDCMHCLSAKLTGSNPYTTWWTHTYFLSTELGSRSQTIYCLFWLHWNPKSSFTIVM